jgi:hypothetical protein
MKTLALLLVISFSSLTVAPAQTSTTTLRKPTSIGNASPNVDSIIRSFTVKETEFRKALGDYAFTRDALIQTIGPGGEVTGEYHRVSQFVFNDQNERF